MVWGFIWRSPERVSFGQQQGKWQVGWGRQHQRMWMYYPLIPPSKWLATVGNCSDRTRHFSNWHIYEVAKVAHRDWSDNHWPVRYMAIHNTTRAQLTASSFPCLEVEHACTHFAPYPQKRTLACVTFLFVVVVTENWSIKITAGTADWLLIFCLVFSGVFSPRDLT